MSLAVAIIADDLTGALDTGTPFVDAGFRVAVAVDVEAVEAAMASGAEVVVVNTVSRAMDPNAAAASVARAAVLLRKASPALVFKKIDSRLKGNVRAETEALATVFGKTRVVIAPAIPDQQRFTRNGMVVGRGVDEPIAIAPLFAGSPLTVDVATVETDGDLDQIVAAFVGQTTLAVGARGLGAALARRFAQLFAVSVPPSPFEPGARTLFAVGSRDPITHSQMQALSESGLLGSLHDAPAGNLDTVSIVSDLPLLLRCAGELADDAHAVARRFAEGVARIAEETRPDMLMIGGGDTAYAILSCLGARVLTPRGEIESGIPWFSLTDGHGQEMRCAVKSGGFGNRQSLLKVLQTNPAMVNDGQ